MLSECKKYGKWERDRNFKKGWKESSFELDLLHAESQQWFGHTFTYVRNVQIHNMNHICKCCEDGHCYSEAQTNSLEVMEIQFILAGGLNLHVALEEMELMWLCSCVILL